MFPETHNKHQGRPLGVLLGESADGGWVSYWVRDGLDVKDRRVGREGGWRRVLDARFRGNGWVRVRSF